MSDAFDAEFGGGAKGFSYNPVNDDGTPNGYFVPLNAPHGGKVLDIQTKVAVTHFTGPQKGQPKYWDEPTNTRPMLQKVITVDTRAGKYPAPSAGPEDDGLRTFWVRDSSDLEKAIKKALNEAPGLVIGSELYGVNTGTRPSKGGGNPARTFAAKHIAPTQQAQDGFFGGDAPAAPPAATVYTPPAAPAQPAYNPQVTAPVQGGPVDPFAGQQAPAAAAVPPGVDPAAWAAFQASQQAAAVPGGNPFA